MARDWKETFRLWAQPFSETDEQKASNVARMINEAIREHAPFEGKGIDVYASGSYRNNTNTRQESDVDVAVVLKDAFFYSLPPNLTAADLGFTNSATYGFEDFRTDVGKALVKKFKKGVTEGDKAFDVHENSYRLDADVAVFLEHRRYTGAVAGGKWYFDLGVEMRSRADANKRIVNWHQQHYEEGVKRNTATKRRFKRVVRILKRLRDDMKNQGSASGQAAAKGIASFLIECLVFNCPDSCFNRAEDSYEKDTRAVLSSLAESLEPGVIESLGIGLGLQTAKSADFVEVNRIKRLFAETQPWSATQACDFVKAAWDHVGFADDFWDW